MNSECILEKAERRQSSSFTNSKSEKKKSIRLIILTALILLSVYAIIGTCIRQTTAPYNDYFFTANEVATDGGKSTRRPTETKETINTFNVTAITRTATIGTTFQKATITATTRHPHPLSSVNNVNAQQALFETPPQPLKRPPARIAVQTVNFGVLGLPLMDQNRHSYCTKWNHDYVVVEAPIGLPGEGAVEVPRSPAWNKIPATLHLLDQRDDVHDRPKYEYVMWMDADAIFLNCQLSLQRLVERMEHDRTSWLFSGDTMLINSGQMMWKNNEASRRILREVDALWYAEFDNYHRLQENGAFAAYLGGARNASYAEIQYAYDRSLVCSKDDQTMCEYTRDGNAMALQLVVRNDWLQRQISLVSQHSINSYFENVGANDFILHCAGYQQKLYCLELVMRKLSKMKDALLCL